MVVITVLGMLLFGVPFNGNVLVLRPRRRPVPVRRARPRRVHLDDLADDGAGDPDGVLLPAAADPAVRHDLPARRDGGGRALDRLPAAADLLHDDLARASCCAAPPSTSLWLPFLVLTVMAVVVFTGATLRFRRDLAPGRRRRQRHEQPRRGRERMTYAVRSATVRFGDTVALDDVSRRRSSRDRSSPSWAATAPARPRCCAHSSARSRLDSGEVVAPPPERIGYLPASRGQLVGPDGARRTWTSSAASTA